SHGGQACYPYFPSAGGQRAAGRLEFTEAVRRMVHSGTPVFHFFEPEHLGASVEDYRQAIDKLRSYGITPYLEGDPSAAELELGQRWLDCLFGAAAYELHASGERFEAASHAVWLEGCAIDSLPVYWGWDPSFARVIAQVIEWRWEWDEAQSARLENAAPQRRRAHCGGTLLGLARALRLVLDKRHELDAHRDALVERGVESAELWGVPAFVAETLLSAVELEAPGLLAEGGPADGSQFPSFVLGLALGPECADGPDAIIERYGFDGAVADAVREALQGIADRPEVQETLARLARELEQGPPRIDASDAAQPGPQPQSATREHRVRLENRTAAAGDSPPGNTTADGEESAAIPSTPRRRSRSATRARTEKVVAPPSPVRLVATLDHWPPLREVGATFAATQSQLDQRLVSLDERRRQLQEARAALDAQLAGVDREVADTRAEQQRLPGQETLATGAALADVLDQGAARFPSGTLSVVLSTRLEASAWQVGCALPLAGDEARPRPVLAPPGPQSSPAGSPLPAGGAGRRTRLG
ncbi:MAG TPA: hypothetical protein VIR57_03325, partial [Chloroflexota bacterium]